jgi:hypothetical protein
VEELIRRITAARLEATSPEDYVQRFLGGFGLEPPPARLQGKELRGAESSWHERSPWEAEIPLEALRRAPFPKLVVRGAWDQVPPDAEAVGKPSFHAVCDVLVDELDAETETIAGVAHSIPRAGERLNCVLREFLEQA